MQLQCPANELCGAVPTRGNVMYHESWGNLTSDTAVLEIGLHCGAMNDLVCKATKLSKSHKQCQHVIDR